MTISAGSTTEMTSVLFSVSRLAGRTVARPSFAFGGLVSAEDLLSQTGHVTADSDDALLASAFRKILTASGSEYICVRPDHDDDKGFITLDGRWSMSDGLTAAELDAMLRVYDEAEGR